MPGNFTPEQIIAMMAQRVVEKICDEAGVPRVGQYLGEKAAQAINAAPPRMFQVDRAGLNGTRVTQHVTLPNALTELSDLMKLSIDVQKKQLEATTQFQEAIEANTEVCQRVLKLNKKAGG